MNIGLKMKFEKEKEKKEISTGHPFSQAAHQPSPRRPTLPLPLFFFPVAVTTGARLSASPPPPFLSSSPRCPPEPAPPRDPRRFPSFPPYQAGQLRQLTFPAINWNCYPSISTEP
jgi:hypothetical protein